MIVRIIPSGGLGHVTPIDLAASQVLVMMDDGTPVMVAAAYGPDGAICVGSASHDGDELNTILRSLGVNMTTVVKRIPRQRVPAGAVLLSSPKRS